MDEYVVFTGNEDQKVLIFIKSITAIVPLDNVTQIYTYGGHTFIVNHRYDDVLMMLNLK